MKNNSILSIEEEAALICHHIGVEYKPHLISSDPEVLDENLWKVQPMVKQPALKTGGR